MRALPILTGSVCLLLAAPSMAATLRGQVTLNGMPVPGATVTVTQGQSGFATITDSRGAYMFPELKTGECTLTIAMTGFVTIHQRIVVTENSPAQTWTLAFLPPGETKARTRSAGSPPPTPAPQAASPPPSQSEKPQPAQDEQLREQAEEGLLINGSVNNSASSPVALTQAFGNNRYSHGLYNGGLGIILDESALDARPYSITGLDTPKPQFNDETVIATFGGPLRVRHLINKDPHFFVGYQWTRNHSDTTQPAIVPTQAERGGIFSQVLGPNGAPVTVFDPSTGQPFADDTIPSGRISPQARALLRFYPLPNLAAGTLYNYQASLLSDTRQDALQSRIDQTLGFRDDLYGNFAFQSTRTNSPGIFSFIDTTDLLGFNAALHYSHRFGEHLFLYPAYSFSRLRTRVTPWFENRENVSANAGITGNDQDPADWGPPSLAFSTGIAGLSDDDSADTREESNGFSLSMYWNRDRHNFSFGGGFQRQEFNDRSQQNPRGTFSFTGAATAGAGGGNPDSGSDFADFLLGIPDTSAIAYGNADKYFRESLFDAYFTDDWRIRPEFTLDAGMRWEYSAPVTELLGRLVNLDVAPGFSAVAPVVAGNGVGPLTGTRYPGSLIHPDRRGLEPRIGLAWRPIAGSSLVVHAGYGVYDDTSVYPGLASQMAQQAPLSRSLRVENSTTCPLTLASGFNPCSATTADTFAVDPNFRPGYAQNWNLTIQRDLPGSMQLDAAYLGTKGTHGMQEFLPNTYPVGAVNPCPDCPVGFIYVTSGGNLSRQAGRVQLRRRLHSGLAASVAYTYSKSIDDDAKVGGQGGSGSQSAAPSGEFAFHGSSASPPPAQATIAQNWLDPGAERGLSTFDQRQLLSLEAQYTTGMGLHGGTLLGGWRGAVYKEWTLLTRITLGSGLPETPVYFAAVPGTGFTGTIRPDRTAAPIYSGPAGHFLNPAAYAAPKAGRWGDAGRDSIIGPREFVLNASLARTFRIGDHLNLDARIDSTNAVNHVTYSGWITTVTSPQFGLPTSADAMRTMQATFRLRF